MNIPNFCVNPLNPFNSMTPPFFNSGFASRPPQPISGEPYLHGAFIPAASFTPLPNFPEKEQLCGGRRRRLCSAQQEKAKANLGKWAVKEHKRFLKAMKLFGNAWPEVVKYIGTRTAAQIRSHAQKYYCRIKRREIQKIKNDPSGKKAIFVVTHEYRNNLATMKMPAVRKKANAGKMKADELPGQMTQNSPQEIVVPVPNYHCNLSRLQVPAVQNPQPANYMVPTFYPYHPMYRQVMCQPMIERTSYPNHIGS